MSDSRKHSVSESVRRAVERTFATTVGSSAELTREKAHELVDEVAKRGEAGSRLAADISARLRDVVLELPLATGDDVKSLREEMHGLADRVAVLERRLYFGPSGQQPEARAKTSSKKTKSPGPDKGASA